MKQCGMDTTTAAWVLKNERSDLGQHADAIAALRGSGSFLRIIHGAPRDGEWPIIDIEPVERPSAAITLYRRALPEDAGGIFWAVSWWQAFLHTADRFGLQMHEASFEPDDLVAEFVMQTDSGRRSGGEFIVDVD